MCAGAFYLLIAACFFVTNSVGNIADNGWRPMSKEKVAELQNFIKYPRNIPSLYTNIGTDRHELERREMQIQPKESKQYVGYDDFLPYWINDLDDHSQSLPSDSELQSNSHNKQLTRKAKKIDDTQVDMNSIKGKNNQDLTQIVSKNDYEVTENTKEDVKEIEERETKFGYFYAKPKANIKKLDEKNNLTRNLFSILADYNIRTSDNLPNYGLSLRQNSRNSDHDYVYMHVPVRVPLSYNSLNHIPLDSLLAVFLSNYGYYLPGLYGFQRNYNNLYGYLASNNIHNNKPFGSYKIFSDTDTYQ